MIKNNCVRRSIMNNQKEKAIKLNIELTRVEFRMFKLLFYHAYNDSKIVSKIQEDINKIGRTGNSFTINEINDFGTIP